jgi:hypothetical protein
MCYHPVSGVSVNSCSGIASIADFGGRSALLILVRVALLLPSDDEPLFAFALPVPEKMMQSPKLLLPSPPSGSTFQRTPYGGWRWSVSFGFILKIPAPVLQAVRLSPVWSEHLPT